MTANRADDKLRQTQKTQAARTTFYLPPAFLPSRQTSASTANVEKQPRQSSSSSALPSYVSVVHHFGSDFCVCDRFLFVCLFFNPTVEIVTFRLCGRCMLSVLLLPAFTRLGHESQELWSLCDGVRVCTDYTSVYTLIRKSLGEWSQNPCDSMGKIPCTGKKKSSGEDRTHDAASSRTASPTHYQRAIPAPDSLRRPRLYAPWP